MKRPKFPPDTMDPAAARKWLAAMNPTTARAAPAKDSKVVSYSDKLRDPRWQKKRLQVFERDNFTCRRCLDKTKSLHLHHAFYDRGKDPWDAPFSALVTLCETCHEMEKSTVHLKVREADARVVRVLKKHLFDAVVFEFAEILDAALSQVCSAQDVFIQLIPNNDGSFDHFWLVVEESEAGKAYRELGAAYSKGEALPDA